MKRRESDTEKSVAETHRGVGVSVERCLEVCRDASQDTTAVVRAGRMALRFLQRTSLSFILRALHEMTFEMTPLTLFTRSKSARERAGSRATLRPPMANDSMRRSACSTLQQILTCVDSREMIASGCLAPATRTRQRMRYLGFLQGKDELHDLAKVAGRENRHPFGKHGVAA